MPTLQEMAAELTGSIPGLSNLYARKMINEGLEELQRDYLWSWMIGEGILIFPDAVSTGTVQVTQFSNTINFSGTAISALNSSTLAVPITKRQFRVPSSGPVYNITAYNNISGLATLDRLYTESTDAVAQYSVYQCYFDPPSQDGVTANTDFLRYLSIENPINGYSIRGKRLYMTRTELNRRDPLRGALGLPYYMATYKPNSAGTMQYEPWPHCTAALTLLCNYQKRHTDLAVGDSLPAQAPVSLVRYAANKYAYRWCMQNSGRIPELKGVDWRFALSEANKTYDLELVRAKKNDKEILLPIFRPGSGELFGYPGNFAQSHDMAGFGY